MRAERAWEAPPPFATPAAEPAPQPVRTVDGAVFRTVVGVIGLGLLLQVVLVAFGRAAHWETAQAIRVGLWADLAFYLAVAALVVRRAQTVSFRPIWTDGDPTASLAWGLAVGGTVAATLLLLARLAAGHFVTDPRINVIVSERTVPRAVAAILIACVAAPWVEELLFRGLAVETLRPRGLPAALVGSAALFALWHTDVVLAGWRLNLGPALYYVAMGCAFGRLYVTRGLKASIAAHTAFNGVLVLAALVLTAGPAHTVTGNGVVARVPAAWHTPAPDQLPPGLDLAVEGPSASGMVVSHRDLPVKASAIDIDAEAENMARGMASMGLEVTPGSLRTADYPMGHVLRLSAKVDGHAAQFVVVPQGRTLWVMVLMAGGSGRAQKDFESILKHLVLPAKP